MITAILLAAGQSRRMGRLKQLLPFGASTVIDNCVDNLRAAKIGELIVVLGHCAEAVSAHLASRRQSPGPPLKSVINASYRDGMTGSIQTGIRNVDERAEAVLLALVDQPHVPTAIINEIIDNYYQHRALIVKPQYQQQSGHPIIIDLACRDEILQLPVDIGLNKVTRAHAAQTLLVTVALRAVIEDIDTPEDYALRLKEFRN